MASKKRAESADPSTSGETSRRGLLKIGVGVIGAGVGVTPLVPASAYLLDPLRRARPDGDFIPAGRRTEFSIDAPVRVDLHADRVDAWNRIKDVKVGSCWVIAREGGLVAFSTVCPHLGCAVDFDATARKFKCPCHRSAFGLDGTAEAGPSPRSLDTLEVQEQGGLVAIRFERFRQGIPNKEPVR